MALAVPSSWGNRAASRRLTGNKADDSHQVRPRARGPRLSATAAFAQQAAFKPAVVYDLGGKFDKSFNEGVHMGAEKFKKDTGTEYRDFEPQNDAQREQALRRFARDGFSPIVAVGFSQETALKKVAEEFPKTQFAIIDCRRREAERAVDRVQGA